MLDDENVLKQRDPQNALGVLGDQWRYLSQQFDQTFEPKAPIENVIWAGMGGSALPAVIIEQWPKLTVPFEIVRDYNLPPYVGQNTLVIVASYSGNTEETLSSLAEAEANGAQIVVMAGGGKLQEKAEANQHPFYKISPGIQPRMASFYFVAAFVAIIRSLSLAVEDLNELATIGDWLKMELSAWSPDVSMSDNYAKQLATQLVGKTVIMYSGPKLFPATNKWKIGMNENAKNTAWANQYPEFNHNEFVGWSSHPVEKPFAVVELRSNLEHDRIQKRFEISERLLSGMRPQPLVVVPHGETLLKQLTWSFALGDFVSVYLAILNGVNPTPVELVERLKQLLD